jgi:tRNA U34 2-thiouridine synthase MnmA/TrmU
MKAICLHSGGLDSSLAILVMKEQGIEPIAAHFLSPFWGREGKSPSEITAEAMGVRHVAVPMGEEYLDIVRNPKHGYGKNANPCIDCHIHMLRKAGALMPEMGASFVVTGEVVGQRPMSQRRDVLRRIEKECGFEGLLLRPLSARLLPETIPEKEGWVDRENLLAISGRSRAEQMNLAREKGLTGYATPAGGCLLTDPGYSRRLRDLIDHDDLTMRQAERLRLGRHFRLPGGSKLVIGRNQDDNESLLASLAEGEVAIITTTCPGPTAVLIGPGAAEEVLLAASMVARYGDDKTSPTTGMEVVGSGAPHTLEIERMSPEDVAGLMI